MIINILARLLYGKGDDNVDVLWAHLILMGKRSLNQVPASLKERVKDILATAEVTE